MSQKSPEDGHIEAETCRDVNQILEDLRTQHSIFSTRFYCALITLHVSAPFGGHLQVVHKHKKYTQGSHYILRMS
jgi:hypothetical protein